MNIIKFQKKRKDSESNINKGKYQSCASNKLNRNSILWAIFIWSIVCYQKENISLLNCFLWLLFGEEGLCRSFLRFLPSRPTFSFADRVRLNGKHRLHCANVNRLIKHFKQINIHKKKFKSEIIQRRKNNFSSVIDYWCFQLRSFIHSIERLQKESGDWLCITPYVPEFSRKKIEEVCFFVEGDREWELDSERSVLISTWVLCTVNSFHT